MQGKERLFLWTVLVAGCCFVTGFIYYLIWNTGAEAQPPVNSKPNAISMEAGEPAEAILEKNLSREIVAPSGDSLMKGEGSASPGKGVITGRVLSEFGGPVVGALIQPGSNAALRIFRGAENRVLDEPLPQEISCTSDEEGKFHLEKVVETDLLRLEIRHDEHAPFIAKIRHFDGIHHDLGDLILERGGSLSGYVTDETGHGLNKVNIMARPVEPEGVISLLEIKSIMQQKSDWQTQTKEGGFFRITGLPAGEVTVSAILADHPMTVQDDLLIIKGEETRDVHLIIQPGLSIAGRVLDEAEEPIAEVTVMVEPGLRFSFENAESFAGLARQLKSAAKTDPQGHFLLTGLREGSYTLRFTAPSYLPLRKEKVNAGTRNLIAVLNKGGWLAGQVQEAGSGKGIERFTLRVDGQGKVRQGRDPVMQDESITLLKGKDAADKQEGHVDPRGAYYIEGLGEYSFTLNVQADGFADGKVTDLFCPPGEGRVVDLLLDPESVISGILLSSSDEPIFQGSISLLGHNKQMGEARSLMQSAGLALPSGETWVTLKTVKTAAEGGFALHGVAEGNYRLRASHELFRDGEPLDLQVRKAEQVEGLILRLGLAGSIVGMVYDTEGEPMPGARVQVCQSQNGLFGLIVKSMAGDEIFEPRQTETDAQGRFRVEGLEPGSYLANKLPDLDEEDIGNLLNTAMSGIVGNSGPGAVKVLVEEGRVSEVDLHDTPKGGIAGTVLEAGRPVGSIKIKLFNSGLGPLAMFPVKITRTDTNGAYLFKNLEQGKYDVRLDLSGHTEPPAETVILRAGQISMQDFVLPSGRVSGRVMDTVIGKPIPGASVSLNNRTKASAGGFFESLFSDSNLVVNVDGQSMVDENEDMSEQLQAMGLGGPPSVVTDSEGCYEITFVKDGEYTLTASCTGYAKKVLEPVVVQAGTENAALDLDLVPGFQVSGIVVDDATGKPLKLCSITCEKLDPDTNDWKKLNTVISKDLGRFAFSRLSPGSYRLTARKKDLLSSLDITLESAGKNDLELRLR